MSAVVVGLVGLGLVALCLHRAQLACSVTPASPEPEPVTPRGDGVIGAAWARRLADAGIDGDPRRWLRSAAAALAVVVVVGAWRGGPVGGAALGVLTCAVGTVVLRATSGRGERRDDARLPDLLEHAARNLRSGLGLVAALETAAGSVGGRHGAEVAAAVGRVDGGAELSAALQPWVEDHPRPPVRLAVGALEVAAHTGGAPARALDGVAATLRARAVVADEARALASQARASAAVLVALPVVVAALGAVADPRLAHTLLATPLGLGCLTLAALLDTVGGWWMHRIVGAGG